jgi:putative hydrolases of HD superfamily
MTILSLLKHVGDLKRLPRTGWVRSGIFPCESVAEHCFRVAFGALILPNVPGFSKEKCVMMGLLHDFAGIFLSGWCKCGCKGEREIINHI